MDGLADQRAAAFAGPASLHRPGVILGRAVPLDVRIGLKNSAQPSRGDGSLEKQDGVVEAMLADHAQLNARSAGHDNHACGRLQVDGHGFLHQHMLAVFRPQLDRGQPVAGKRAHIDIVHIGALAELIRRGYELRAN